MPASPKTYQQLHASNVSPNIEEELQARVKDPLWFLARQWQAGEFEAEAGGRPVQVTMTSRPWNLNEATLGANTQRVPLRREIPLQAQIEPETASGESPAWQSASLEYQFRVHTGNHDLVAPEYEGSQLDWFHFDQSSSPQNPPPPAPRQSTQRVVPTELNIPGAPHAAWWRLEQGDAYYDSPKDPEPNVLSLLLPEFSYLDSDDWHIVPMQSPVGCVDEITAVSLVDSFGLVTTVEPAASDDQFALFTLHGSSGSSASLFLPGTVASVLENEMLEEVRFARDELSNLVWACEQSEAEKSPAAAVAASPSPSPAPAAGTLPVFRLKNSAERFWIPYLPRQISDANGVNRGQIALRRGRTDETATRQNPQFRTRLVRDSVWIHEEAIPASGLTVRRLKRSTLDSEGIAHFWVARQKSFGRPEWRNRMVFDSIGA